MTGRVLVRGQNRCSNLIPVPVPDFWLSGKTQTRTHTQSTQVLPVKVGTDSDGYPRVRVFLPCLILAPQIKKLSMNAPSCLIQTAILRNEFKKKNWPSKELVVKWFEPFKKLIIFNQVYLSKIMNR